MADHFFDIKKPFESARLKLTWARHEHMVRLRNSMRDFQKASKIESGPIPGGFSFNPPNYPAHICLGLGDAIHNLRTALDLLACDLVRVNGKSTRSVYFPFATSREGLKEQIKNKNFDRAPAEAIELLKQLQPYTGGNALLRALHDLDVMDKHQIIMPVAHLAVAKSAVIKTDAGGQIELRNVAFVGADVFGGGPNTVVSGDFVIEAQFGSAAPATIQGREVLTTLESMAQIVEDVIKAFSDLFASRGFPPGGAPHA